MNDERNNSNRNSRYQDDDDYKPRRKKRKKFDPEKAGKPHSLVAIGVFFGALFVSLCSYICVYSYVNKQVLFNNSYNKRQATLSAQNTRGMILSSDGEILAQTVTDEEGTETRTYPFGSEFSHIVGYSTHGRTGIEDLANYYLINSSISLSEKASDDEQNTKYPGDNVYTTLIPSLQKIASDSLGVYSGAVVVTNPKTGEILAMVSKPDYDPNDIDAEWETLTTDSKNESRLLNRATQGLYPPGSTFKIMTSLEYIRENPDTYNNYSYTCTGSFSHGEDTIKCFHGEKHGTLDFFGSFAKSCNSSFANIGLTLDRNKYNETLTDLMFNEDLPLDLNYSKSTAICEDDTSDSDIMQLAIGQGTTSMSPMHLNMITCAIANNGVLMKPYVLDHVESDDGKTVESFSSKQVKRLMSDSEAEILTQMMEGVVNNGTASRLKGLTYTAAGKTGSAEYSNLTTDSHAWFTGFAPADDPQICVTIIIEKAGSGGEYAVPVAKRIFDEYFGA